MTYASLPFRYALLASALLLSTVSALAQSNSSFAYSGVLKSGDIPLDGSYVFQFGLYDALEAGNQVGTTSTIPAQLTNGTFTVSLDFGNQAFRGQTRYLEMRIKEQDETDYTNLSPRSVIAPVPHAQFAIASDYTTTATYASSAEQSLNAQFATTAEIADNATTATFAGHAETAQVATIAQTLAGFTTASIPSLGYERITQAQRTLEPNRKYIVDRTSGYTTLTLPANPAVGDAIEIARIVGRPQIAIRPNENQQFGTPETTQFINETNMLNNWERDYYNSLWARGNNANYAGASSGVGASDDDQVIVLPAGNSGLRISRDGGDSWETPTTTTAVASPAHVSADGSTIFIRNSSLTHVLLSKDYGTTWETVETTFVISSSLCAGNGQDLYVAGAVSGNFSTRSYHRSVDGGQTWEAVSRPDGTSQVNLTIISHDGDWILGVAIPETGRCFISTDKGLTWPILTNPVNSRLIGYSKHGEVLYFYSTGNIYRTDDRGQTWTQLPVPSGMPTPSTSNCQVSNDGFRIKIGDFYSADKGTSWQRPSYIGISGTVNYLNSLCYLASTTTRVISLQGSAYFLCDNIEQVFQPAPPRPTPFAPRYSTWPLGYAHFNLGGGTNNRSINVTRLIFLGQGTWATDNLIETFAW